MFIDAATINVYAMEICPKESLRESDGVHVVRFNEERVKIWEQDFDWPIEAEVQQCTFTNSWTWGFEPATPENANSLCIILESNPVFFN